MKRKSFICTIIIFVLVFLLANVCYGTGMAAILKGKTITPDEIASFNTALDFFANTCYVVAVGIIMIQGVRFIQAAPEGKAKIKEDMTKIFIGAGFATATGTIIKVVRGIAEDSNIVDKDKVLGRALTSMNVGCYAAAFVLLMWMGIKWLTTAPEGKAEIKKGLLIAGLGAILLFGARNHFNDFKINI